MKTNLFLLIILFAQSLFSQYNYKPNSKFPFGQPNPEAPKEIKDFAPLIGLCDCKSESRKADQLWAEPVNMTWEFKYIMNGMAVQDETLKEDGKHSGSIRQFSKDSSRWYVHYYSSATPTTILSTWEGNKKDDKILLYRPQKAPNGMDGFYRISFYDISEDGFKWLGEWVNKDESFAFPTWKISCKKRKSGTKSTDEDEIKAVANEFSELYLKQDYEGLARLYTTDAKIFPSGSPIIEGYEAIKKRWSGSSDYTPLEHKITPREIIIQGDTAYDHGIYQGKNKNQDGAEVSYRGKYVIVWKKVKNNWKMYLDIWNRIN